MNKYIDKLTPRQLMFCLNYLSNEFNSAQSAMIAAGYDEEYALRNRHNILKNSNIIGFLREEKRRRAQEAALKAIDFHSEMIKRAFTTEDDELRLKYSQEARQWAKQKEEFNLKFKELEERVNTVDSSITLKIEGVKLDEPQDD